MLGAARGPPPGRRIHVATSARRSDSELLSAAGVAQRAQIAASGAADQATRSSAPLLRARADARPKRTPVSRGKPAAAACLPAAFSAAADRKRGMGRVDDRKRPKTRRRAPRLGPTLGRCSSLRRRG
ncbi:hypothetical protein MRX96_006846 [Rhipicephalus microplus]